MLKFLCLGLIRAYQLVLSPLIGPCCRFQPSCSEYGHEAFSRHTPWHAFYLTARRVLRCNPWGGSGYDPVPQSRECHSCHHNKGF